MLEFFPRERLDFGEKIKWRRREGKKEGREGLIFFPRGREGGGELKRERRLAFFSCQLETCLPSITPKP